MWIKESVDRHSRGVVSSLSTITLGVLMDTTFKQALTYMFDVFTKHIYQLSYVPNWLAHLGSIQVNDYALACTNHPRI